MINKQTTYKISKIITGDNIQIIQKIFSDTKLTLKQKSILTHLFFLEKDNLNLEEIVFFNNPKTESASSFFRTLKELVKLGFVRYRKIRTPKGKFNGIEMLIPFPPGTDSFLPSVEILDSLNINQDFPAEKSRTSNDLKTSIQNHDLRPVDFSPLCTKSISTNLNSLDSKDKIKIDGDNKDKTSTRRFTTSPVDFATAWDFVSSPIPPSSPVNTGIIYINKNNNKKQEEKKITEEQFKKLYDSYYPEKKTRSYEKKQKTLEDKILMAIEDLGSFEILHDQINDYVIYMNSPLVKKWRTKKNFEAWINNVHCYDEDWKCQLKDVEKQEELKLTNNSKIKKGFEDHWLYAPRSVLEQELRQLESEIRI